MDFECQAENIYPRHWGFDASPLYGAVVSACCWTYTSMLAGARSKLGQIRNRKTKPDFHPRQTAACQVEK
jgi:hypothetical protein